MHQPVLIAALLLAIGLAGCAGTQGARLGSPPAQASGGVLADPAGMTLYVFDKDSDGKSACNGECAVKRPPLLAGAGAAASGDFALIQRADGKAQWTYKGKPLYLWFKDQKPGDTTGDGVNNVWHTARP
jgi:predicted lipoprotein with Yx(FWY)xxD motif